MSSSSMNAAPRRSRSRWAQAMIGASGAPSGGGVIQVSSSTVAPSGRRRRWSAHSRGPPAPRTHALRLRPRDRLREGGGIDIEGAMIHAAVARARFFVYREVGAVHRVSILT